MKQKQKVVNVNFFKDVLDNYLYVFIGGFSFSELLVKPFLNLLIYHFYYMYNNLKPFKKFKKSFSYKLGFSKLFEI